MKEILSLLLLMLALAQGVNDSIQEKQTEQIANETEFIRQEDVAHIETDNLYEAYHAMYQEIAEMYGKGEMVDQTDDYWGLCYLKGVCVVDLLDFNCDGVDDLLLVCHKGTNSGLNIDDKEIPLGEDYQIEIWTVNSKKLSRLLSVDYVSSYETFPTEYWNSEQCFLNVWGNRAGVPILQLYQEDDSSCTYSNYYFKDGELTEDICTYTGDIYLKNEISVSEDQWMGEVADFDKILVNAYFSSDNSGYEDTLIYEGIDMLSTLKQTQYVVEALDEGESASFEAVENDYISAYQDILMEHRLRRIKYGRENDFEYALCDMNQDGVQELFLLTGSCEADYGYTVYTLKNGSAIWCGEFHGGHGTVYIGNEPGLIMYWGQMGVYGITKYTLIGIEIIGEEIVSGEIAMEEEYPELSEFGFGAYDTYLSCCKGTTSYALCQSISTDNTSENSDVSVKEIKAITSGTWVDLDGDGTQEQIVYLAEGIGEETSYMSYPETVTIKVGDSKIVHDGVNTEREGYLVSMDEIHHYIVVGDHGMSADYCSTFYEYKCGELSIVGQMYAHPKSLIIYEDKVIAPEETMHLQCQPVKFRYELIDGVFVKQKDDYYEYRQNIVIAQQEIQLYSSADVGEIGIMIEAGEEVQVMGGDMEKWVLLRKIATGEKGWLQVEKMNDCILPDGEVVSAYDLFEELYIYG